MIFVQSFKIFQNSQVLGFSSVLNRKIADFQDSKSFSNPSIEKTRLSDAKRPYCKKILIVLLILSILKIIRNITICIQNLY